MRLKIGKIYSYSNTVTYYIGIEKDMVKMASMETNSRDVVW